MAAGTAAVETYARFTVGPEHYGVPVRHVLEIRELGACTPVPGAPPAILGVRNVRGQVLPVADLASVLGVKGGADCAGQVPGLMLVAEHAGLTAGLAISDVIDVGELPDPSPADDLTRPPPGREGRHDLVAGTTMADDELVGVLDVPKVFQALAEMAP
jgi:purine-binding chemotaxis protein CheW